jgi:hypothetical protein
MFKEADRVDTPKGPGIIIRLQKSTYSKTLLFYVVDLDSGEKNYLCTVPSAKQLQDL